MSKTNPLQALLDKAVAALPAKSPVRVEITEALAARAKFTERAQRAWETMRKNRGDAPKPAPIEAKAPAKSGPAPKATKVKLVGKRDVPAAKVVKAKASPAAAAAH